MESWLNWYALALAPGLAGASFLGLACAGASRLQAGLPSVVAAVTQTRAQHLANLWLRNRAGLQLSVPAKLPLSREGIPAREGGGRRAKLRKLESGCWSWNRPQGAGCTWLRARIPWELKTTFVLGPAVDLLPQGGLLGPRSLGVGLAGVGSSCATCLPPSQTGKQGWEAA